MSKEHNITSVTDMLALSAEEFGRMLPDLVVWWHAAKAIAEIDGATNTGFTWLDDGAIGVDCCEITDPATGQFTRHPIVAQQKGGQ